MSKQVWKSIAVGVMCLLCQREAFSSPISDLQLPPPGAHPNLPVDCDTDKVLPQTERPAEAAPAMQLVGSILSAAKSPYASDIFAMAPDEVIWYLEVIKKLDLNSLGMGIHEAGHAADRALSTCHDGRAAYYLDGKVWVTELRLLGETPTLSAAKRLIPEDIKVNRVRYRIYFDPKNNNELALVLDELNSYAGTAEMELALVGSALYQEEFAVADTVDGNLGGTADLMLFLASHLRAIHADAPEAWNNIRNSPKLLAYMQHVWSKSESLMVQHMHLHLKTYVVPKDVLALTYTPAFIGELDQLGIKHLAQPPVE